MSDAPRPPKTTVTVTIDGRPIEADPSRSVLQVALENGIPIPYFCYHPYLSVPGNCRQCQVKVEKMPKLVVSCNTRVADGMVVDTKCDEVREAQQANMEFLLINHPLDCPICDQVGECWLQEHAFTAGPGRTRFVEDKVHFDKRVDVGPHVLLDKERCIKCTRCIRFCDEVTGTSELALFARSDHTEVDIFPGQPLDNPYSGNVVDICPVGALTLKEFRFQSRLWFLKTADGVCPGCARGCNVRVWHRDGAISRLTPRDNPDVNRSWMCDYGRLIGPVLAAGTRLREPLLRDGGAAARPVDWGEALEQAAAALRGARGRVAAVLRADATQEATTELIGLLETVAEGRVEVAVPAHEEGANDELLIRSDRTPNRRGVLELLAGRQPGLTELSALAARARAGALGALVVVGEDLHDAGLPAADAAALIGVPYILAVASHTSPTTDRASLALPSAVFPEFAGTWVNCEGRAQRTEAAYPPPFLARPAARILADLRAGLGTGV